MQGLELARYEEAGASLVPLQVGLLAPPMSVGLLAPLMAEALERFAAKII